MKLRGSTGRWQSAPVPAAAPEAADEVVGEVIVADAVATQHRRRRQLLQRIGEAALKEFAAGLGEGSRPAQQRQVRQLFSRIALSAGMIYRSARKLLPGGTNRSLWQRDGADTGDRPGRPKGTFKISDTALKELLRPHTRSSSSWSMKANAPMLVLQDSRRGIFSALDELQKSVSYRTFTRRLAAGRLGIGAGSKRVDVCDYCAAFDQEATKLRRELTDFGQAVEALDAEFFVSWRQGVLESPEFSAVGFQPEASPKYLASLLAYVRARAGAGPQALRDMAARFVEELEGKWLPVSKGYSSHWQLRDNQWGEHQHHLSAPAARTLYVHWDMQEPARRMLRCAPRREWGGPLGGLA